MADEETGTGGAPPGAVTLAIDVGGTKLKAGLLDASGGLLGTRVRCDTPQPAPPAAVMEALAGLIKQLGPFDRVSVGFPGVVRAGAVLTAPNLGTQQWHGFGLAAALSDRYHRPVRVLNDASVQGLGVIAGQGLECVITLGTGFGFALYEDGRLAPHLEMGQHFARKDMTYDQYVGVASLQRNGKRKWVERVERVIKQLDTLVTYDALYIGGGNAKLIDFDLPANVRVVSNDAGITGGVKLWGPAMDEAFSGVADANVVAPATV